MNREEIIELAKIIALITSVLLLLCAVFVGIGYYLAYTATDIVS